MRYEGSVYRPPSEADSLIVQLTIGCARNTCTFCSMYKDKTFRVRPLEEVTADLTEAKSRYAAVRRVFLADGDALVVKTPDLLTILESIAELFPGCERVSLYGAPADVLGKSREELASLREAGIKMIYIGAESGSDQVLSNVKKGVSAAEISEAGRRLREAGIAVSMTLISGLGGRPLLDEHAVQSARLISAVRPEYVGFLTLSLEPGTPLTEDVLAGRFVPISPGETAEEMRLFLRAVDSEGTVFRSNHASNYFSLAGTLNADRAAMLAQVDRVIERGRYKPEMFRGL